MLISQTLTNFLNNLSIFQVWLPTFHLQLGKTMTVCVIFSPSIIFIRSLRTIATYFLIFFSSDKVSNLFKLKLNICTFQFLLTIIEYKLWGPKNEGLIKRQYYFVIQTIFPFPLRIYVCLCMCICMCHSCIILNMW